MTNQLSENPEVGLRPNQNQLIVDGHQLRVDVLKDSKSEKITVSPEELERVLLLGRVTLLQGIEEFYENTKLKNPNSTVVRPSIWTAQLGNKRQSEGRDGQIFTPLGYANGGIITHPDEVKTPFLYHWESVTNAGFMPEIRRSAEGDSAWLLLRKPTIEQTLQYWLGYPMDTFEQVKKYAGKYSFLKKHRVKKIHRAAEIIVDDQPNEHRPRFQIARDLSMAALRLHLGNISMYREGVEDIFNYLDNDPSAIDEPAIRAIENSTYGTL